MTRLLALTTLISVVLALGGCVDTNFIYVTDNELYGKSEHWTYPLKKDGLFYGDCEDYAIQKVVDAGKGVVLIVETGKPIKHAVALIDEKVYDLDYTNTRSIEDYEVLQTIDWLKGVQ